MPFLETYRCIQEGMFSAVKAKAQTSNKKSTCGLEYRKSPTGVLWMRAIAEEIVDCYAKMTYHLWVPRTLQGMNPELYNFFMQHGLPGVMGSLIPNMLQNQHSRFRLFAKLTPHISEDKYGGLRVSGPRKPRVRRAAPPLNQYPTLRFDFECRTTSDRIIKKKDGTDMKLEGISFVSDLTLVELIEYIVYWKEFAIPGQHGQISSLKHLFFKGLPYGPGSEGLSKILFHTPIDANIGFKTSQKPKEAVVVRKTDGAPEFFASLKKLEKRPTDQGRAVVTKMKEAYELMLQTAYSVSQKKLDVNDYQNKSRVVKDNDPVFQKFIALIPTMAQEVFRGNFSGIKKRYAKLPLRFIAFA